MNAGLFSEVRMLERRHGDPRDLCHIEAAIVIGPNVEAPCLIENISAGGAKLRVAADLQIDTRFRLLLPLTASLREDKPVRLRWRRGADIGVQFEIAEGGCVG